ncbi:MAG: AI-2E family transporter [Cyanobacteria bacterium P01_F01_bin.153]
MPSIRRLIRWFLLGLMMPLIFLNGWVMLQIFDYFQSILTIAIAAVLISFILGYPVSWLENSFSSYGMKRPQAVFCIMALTVGVVAIGGVILTPLLLDQIQSLAEGLPVWINSSDREIRNFLRWLAQNNDYMVNLDLQVESLLAEAITQVSAQVQNLTSQLLVLLLEAAGRVSEALITFVIVVYLLLRGDTLWDGIMSWFPPSLAGDVRRCVRQNFHNYYAGQATLAGLIGSTMLVLFLIMQVPFGLIFGLAIGVVAFLPFGAGISITVVSVLLAFKDIWLGVRVLIFAFALDQLIENAIAPRLLGRFTGLNPVWVLLSILAGFKVAGVLGVVIAVPLAGTIKSFADASHPRGAIAAGDMALEKSAQDIVVEQKS